MASSSRLSALCPCLPLSRWLQSARSCSPRQLAPPHLELVSASASVWPRSRTALFDTNGGAGVGFVANGSGCGSTTWRNVFGVSNLGLRSANSLHEGKGRNAIKVGRAGISTRCCTLQNVSGEGHGESSESLSDRCATANGLVSRTVAERAVTELPRPPPEAGHVRKSSRKRMCYYFSQGLCNLMEDELHLSKFSHEYPNMSVRADDLEKVKPQPFSYFLVLDLEGMVEILEFPVLMLDAKTLQVVDRFHRFVRPCKMSEEKIEDYIRNKYGKWGLDRVWHDTAIPFTQVLPAFEGWLESHGLYDCKSSSKLKTAAFVTCGNWDVKTKIPEQCVTSEIKVPPYFNEWINLKDIFYNFYKFRAGGMLAMMKGLKLQMEGTHHVGLDDAHNITRVLQRMLADGVIMQISAKRKDGGNSKDVRFTFKFRIK